MLIAGKHARPHGARAPRVEEAPVQRLHYLALSVGLLGVEIAIACCFHDRFVRPFVGDALVVCLLYTLLRSCWPPPRVHPRRLALAVLLFCFLVEALQGLDYVAWLGLEGHRWISVLLGRTFSLEDFAAYTAGYAAIRGAQAWTGRAQRGKPGRHESDDR